MSSQQPIDQVSTHFKYLSTSYITNEIYSVAINADIIDPAMLRPGRFDKLLYVPLPSPFEREDILLTLSKKLPVSGDVDMQKIAMDERCSRFSGADLSSLVREASFERLREYLKREKEALAGGEKEEFINIKIEMKHFNAALNKIGPSVSQQDEKRYNRLQKKFSNFVQTDEAADSKGGSTVQTEGASKPEVNGEENTMQEDKQ